MQSNIVYPFCLCLNEFKNLACSSLSSWNPFLLPFFSLSSFERMALPLVFAVAAHCFLSLHERDFSLSWRQGPSTGLVYESHTIQISSYSKKTIQASREWLATPVLPVWTDFIKRTYIHYTFYPWKIFKTTGSNSVVLCEMKICSRYCEVGSIAGNR